jgi:hypothetical protein
MYMINLVKGILNIENFASVESTNNPTQRPNNPTQRPNNPTQRPNNPTQRPNNPTQRPNNPTQRPNNPTQGSSRSITQRPNNPTQRPNNPTQGSSRSITQRRNISTTQKPISETVCIKSTGSYYNSPVRVCRHYAPMYSSKYIGDFGYAGWYKENYKNPIKLDLNLNNCDFKKNFFSSVPGRLSLDHCKKANKYINDIDKYLENVCKGKKNYELIEDAPIKDIIDKLKSINYTKRFKFRSLSKMFYCKNNKTFKKINNEKTKCNNDNECMFDFFLGKDRFCFESKCLFKTDIDNIKSTRDLDKAAKEAGESIGNGIMSSLSFVIFVVICIIYLAFFK